MKTNFLFLILILFCIKGMSQALYPSFDFSRNNIQFSNTAGFYTNPFQLTITSLNQSCTLLYTIDGSNPASSATAIKANQSAEVQINPDIAQNRGKTPAFIVRVALLKGTSAPSFPVTQTFIFTEKVATQKAPGWKWPTNRIKGKVFDYEMADDVVSNDSYGPLLIDALMQIPSISITTDMKNLFDSSTGIYVNSEQKGVEWERDCSVELMNPNGDAGFQVNAGLRIRGGNSAKNKDNAKNGFRLFFRSQYGSSKLEFPLFGNEGVSEFDKIDLRCEQNYSWSMDGSPYNNLVKDIFCRDLLGAMGQPYSRGRYYHLYLNGMYWGIFQTDERPEANFAESYLGGDEEDYDVIKVDTQPWPYYVEATDGNMDSWEALWNLCNQGFETNKKYFNIEGKDANGKRIDSGNVWVDIDNLIDYMLIIFYSGNYDAPVSAWYSNDMPNNFFAIYNRENKSMGYQFINHDSEHSLFVDPVNIGAGLKENRVNLGSTGKMQISDVEAFNPQWLHHRLCSNAEYRLRFADRAYLHLSEGGLLSPVNTKTMYEKRAKQIDIAIIAESARWGDAQFYYSLTRDDDWLPTIESMYSNYFPYRSNIVVKQLQDEGLFSKFETPELFNGEEKITARRYSFSNEVTLTLTKSGSGELYYTTNGSDPRQIGGAPNAEAKQGSSKTTLKITSTTIVNARVKLGNDWGALKTCYVTSQNEDYSNLKVTELCYHPQSEIINGDTLFDESFEFIEFKNIGSTIIDLSGLQLDSGIRYIFPDYTVLEPGSFYVVAGKPNAFYSRYGVYPSGNFQGKLSNSGELIILNDRMGKSIMTFEYDDKSPWPKQADGERSLVSKETNPTGNPNSYSYWRVSSREFGSPFADDWGTTVQQIATSFNIKAYPNPTTDILTICEYGNELNECSFQLLSMDGKTLLEDYFDQKTATINLVDLGIPSGMYLLRVSGETSTVVQKIIFQSKH